LYDERYTVVIRRDKWADKYFSNADVERLGISREGTQKVTAGAVRFLRGDKRLMDEATKVRRGTERAGA